MRRMRGLWAAEAMTSLAMRGCWKGSLLELEWLVSMMTAGLARERDS